MRKFIYSFLAISLFAAGRSSAADGDVPPAPGLRKAAIIVENRAGEKFNEKVPVLEDLLSSRIAGKGYSVISREITIDALKSYRVAGVTASSQTTASVKAGLSSDGSSMSLQAGQSQSDRTTLNAAAGMDTTSGENQSMNAGVNHTDASAAAIKAEAKVTSQRDAANVEAARSDSAQIAATPDSTALDDALTDNSSALRLAQNLGADFILIPAITSYGVEKKTYSGNGINTVNLTYTLRVSYRIVEAGEGGAIQGGMVAATKVIRQTDDLQTEDSDLINGLLDDTAGQLADAIVANAAALPTEIAAAKMVHFRVVCTMTDPRQQPIVVSALGITADNRVVLTNEPVAMEPMDVTVELDGVALGSAPGEFQAQPGLHKLRLSREGFDDWARTVNIYEGQTLRVALQISPEGYERWADTTAFLSQLDANRKLTDAEVNKLNGLAEFFKNSHYRIDAKQAPSINIYKSLF